MKLSAVLPHVRALLAASPDVRLIPCIEQDDLEYNPKLEAAFQDPGVAFVLWLTDGSPAPDTEEIHAVHLENLVTLAVCVNRAKNTTGGGALYWVETLLALLHHSGHPAARGRRPLRIDTPTFNMGPLNTGLVTYFVTFRVRSENPLLTPTP